MDIKVSLDISRELHRIAADLDALAERIQLDKPVLAPWGRCSASVISTGSLRDRLKSATEVVMNIATTLSSHTTSLGVLRSDSDVGKPTTRP